MPRVSFIMGLKERLRRLFWIRSYEVAMVPDAANAEEEGEFFVEAIKRAGTGGDQDMPHPDLMIRLGQALLAAGRGVKGFQAGQVGDGIEGLDGMSKVVEQALVQAGEILDEMLGAKEDGQAQVLQVKDLIEGLKTQAMMVQGQAPATSKAMIEGCDTLYDTLGLDDTDETPGKKDKGDEPMKKGTIKIVAKGEKALAGKLSFDGTELEVQIAEGAKEFILQDIEPGDHKVELVDGETKMAADVKVEEGVEAIVEVGEEPGTKTDSDKLDELLGLAKTQGERLDVLEADVKKIKEPKAEEGAGAGGVETIKVDDVKKMIQETVGEIMETAGKKSAAVQMVSVPATIPVIEDKKGAEGGEGDDATKEIEGKKNSSAHDHNLSNSPRLKAIREQGGVL